MKRLHNYSQHFLKNPRFVHELIGHTSIKPTDVVYDIGAGSGVISSALARRCKKVVAIEIEPQTAEILRKNMAAFDNVEVKVADFLALKLPETPYKIFANIPFHLTTPIVRKITEDTNPPVAAYLIVQKQFANKLLPAHNGFSSQLGMILGVSFSFRIRKRLKRSDFWPHPNVDTVLLEIKRRDQPLVNSNDLISYREFIHKSFTNPAAFAGLPLAAIGKNTGVKPSSLTLDEWVSLFNASYNYS